MYYRIFCFYLFISAFVYPGAKAQKVIHHLNPQQGQIYFTDQIAIDREAEGYTLVLPDTGDIKGLIVNFHSNTKTNGKEERVALTHHIAVMYVSTGNRLDFFFEDQAMLEVEQYIHEVVFQYDIPPENLLYFGQSIGGTRAVKMVIFSQSDTSVFHITPAAVAMADSPLDFVRFWKQEHKALQDNHNTTSVNEAQWVSAYLEKNLGGTPMQQFDRYVDYSPYCHSADGGKYLELLTDIAIRSYHEPDVHWWMQNRGKTYYEMNVIDGAALVNELNLMDNTKAELILTEEQGYYPDGSRHPHSGSIVDFEEMVEWFLAIITHH